MGSALEKAFSNLIKALKFAGFTKEATEIEAFNPAQPAHQQQTGNRFQAERTPAAPQTTPQQSDDPIQILTGIIQHIEKSPSFKNLPQKVINGILKIKKMTGGASRYASDKEAFLGGRDPLKELKNVLTKFHKSGPDYEKIPDTVFKAVDTLNDTIDQELAARPKEKGILERGRDVAKGLAERGRDVAKGVVEKGQQIKKDIGDRRQMKEDVQTYKTMKRFEDQQAVQDREQTALSDLKNSLFKHRPYYNIFGKLPPTIARELENIGLGLGDLQNMATVKIACYLPDTLKYYFESREAYSSKELSMGKKEEKEHADVYNTFSKAMKNKNIKPPMTINEFAIAVAKAHLEEDPKYYTKLKKTFKEAMDFSSISGLITPDGKLDERALSRVIRLAIAAELDAVHLYELIVDASDNATIKKVLQSIADEEKVHTGELQELLKKFDKEDEKFLEEGKKEVQDMSKEADSKKKL